MTNSSLKSKIALNDLVHLNSYFITKKISDGQFIRVNFTLELPKLSNRGSYQLLDIYVEREKIAQRFLLNEKGKHEEVRLNTKIETNKIKGLIKKKLGIFYCAFTKINNK